MGRVTVACIRNPFDPLVSREIRHFEPGKSVRELAMEFYPSGSEEYDLEVALDGVRILDESKFDLIPKEGVSVAFCAVPKDGGDGKNPLALIASLALVIAAPYAAGALAGAYIGAAGVGYSSLLAGAAYLAGMGGTLIVGGLLINAVFPPSIPDAPNMGSYENSPTYSWDSGGNPLVEGTILPELLGKVRITPPVIGKYVETLGDKQYLNLLYAIAGHRIGSLYGLRVSGVDTTDSGNILTTQHAMTGNFNDVSVEGREGKVNQTVIQAFADTREDVAVGSKLNETTWTTRTTNGNGVQGFGVTIGLPKGLFYANDSGGLNAQTVKVYIEYSVHGQNNWIPAEVYSREDYTISTSRWSAGYYGEWVPGNGWVELEAGSSNPADHVEGERYADAIWDADTQVRPLAYWRWVVGEQIVQRGTLVTGYVTITAGQSKPIHRVFYKDNLSPGQYDIRCKLVDALPTGARYGNDVYFESFQEIVYDDFTYPGMGLLAVRALATDQLSGSIPKIDVIATRSTVPVWTGSTYEDKPADNPAWGCYHLLHRAWRDDGGTVHVEGVAKERIVYSAFESWASWCATQGYTCNIYFDSGFSVRRALDIVGLNGRGVVVQLGSKFSCIVDRPDTAVQRFLFTMGNIEKITFQEEWLPMEDRANAIEVTYFDNNLGRQTVELYAYDFDTTDREINKAQQTLYGCTDRDLAIKYGTFRLNCNRYLTLTGSWGADVDAIACVQGDVVEAAHDVPRFGVSGRVVSSAASSITLDRPVTIEGGKTYYVTVKHQDDDTRETKTVTNGAGTYTTLNISGSWAKNPALHAIYSFGETGLVTKAMRVVHIARAQDLRKKLICQEYISEVYTDGATIPLPPVPPALPIVRNLKAMEIYTGGKATGVTLSWEGRVETVWIYQRQTGMSWQLIGTTSGASYQISNLGAGQEYQFAVCNSANPADGQTVTITLSGRDVLPAIADPVFDDARCTYTDKIQLVWLPIADELLGFFELRTDLDWGNPTNMVYQGKATSFTMKPTQSSYTFYLKSHDTFLNYSSGYDSITLTHTVPVPVFVSIDGSTFGRVRIEWEPINDESYDVVEVWRSLTNDRDTATLKGAIHSNVFVDASVTVSTTYYYWFRTKSIFGTYSAWESGQTAGHSVATAQITTAEIADNAISQIKLATSIVPPEVVDSLPTLPDDAYPEGKIVYLASDGKLYRNDQVGGGGVNATDNFNRSSLGANWTQQPVDSGTVVTTGSAYCAASGSPDAFAYWNASAFGNDQFVQVKIQNISNWADDAGPAVRMSDSANTCYRFVWLPGTNRWNLERVSSGSITNLDYATSPVPQNGDIVRITAIGTSVRGYVNGQLICQATDANIASGQPGIYVGDSTTYLDDWYASEIGGGSIGWSAVVDGADILDGTVSHTALFDQIVAGQIAAGAIGADEIAANVIATKHLVVANFENLIPNGNSEQGSLVVGLTPEGTDLVNEPSNAYAGNWCRKLIAGAGAGFIVSKNGTVTNRIQCSAGEEYYFSAWIKCTSGGATFRVYMAFFDSDNNALLVPYADIETTGSYQHTSVSGIAPSGATNIYFVVQAIDAGTYYIDNMVAKRKIDTNLIVDGAITAAKVGANEIIAQSGNIKDLVVTTIKVADNAITTPVSAYTSGGIQIGSDYNNIVTIQSATITTHGSPVHIIFNCQFSQNYLGTSYLIIELYRGSTLIRGANDTNWDGPISYSMAFVDQPSAGTYTYYVKACRNTDGTIPNAQGRSLLLLETRK